MMTFRLVTALALLAVLAACATPRDMCIANSTHELRKLDALIAQTEAGLRRGFVERTRNDVVTVTDLCLADGGNRLLCDRDVWVTSTERFAIDPAAERRKLANLRQRRAEEAQRAAGAVAACAARFPQS